MDKSGNAYTVLEGGGLIVDKADETVKRLVQEGGANLDNIRQVLGTYQVLVVDNFGHDAIEGGIGDETARGMIIAPLVQGSVRATLPVESSVVEGLPPEEDEDDDDNDILPL